ncbi:Putative Sec1 family protein [Giardia duodenalis]|uniref:Putative Sec1 family protein n=1 Tax=Giardia intestinalis TaxID=5741 RepID=V6T9K0_GIAIN|nr:Putative Sec1 family protein [Giardia intestinalis]
MLLFISFLVSVREGGRAVQKRMASLARQLIGGLTRILQSSPQVSETWFVLVVDDCARQVLRHLLGARDMMVRNVALIIGIEDQRQPIPTACAVYFCSPTQKNFGLFHGHIKAGYYASYEFIACTGPTQLHQLAFSEFRADMAAGKLVTRLIEYPMSLRMICDDIYTVYTSSAEPSDVLKANVRALYSYFASFSRGNEDALNRTLRIPYIYTCGKKAKQLVLAFFEELQANNIRSERLAGHVLMLADREADPIPLFYHPYTYTGLMSDLGIFSGGDSDKKDEPPLGLGPAFQDAIFKTIRTQHFTTATEHVNKLLHDLSNNYASAMDAKAAYSHLLNNMDTMKTKKANCERHTNICSKLLTYITEESIKKYIDIEQEQISSQRKSLFALSAALTSRGASLTKEEEEHLVRTIICVLLGSQDNLDALINGLFAKVKDLLDLLSSVSGIGPTDLQTALQSYAFRIRDAGTAVRPSGDQQAKSGQWQAMDAFVDVAMAFAKKGIDALMGKQTSLLALLLTLIAPSTLSQPRYNNYFSLEAYGGTFHGAATTVGLFIVGEGSLEEASRLKLEIQQAFRENQMDAPNVTYGCTSFPAKRMPALSALIKAAT